MLNVSKILEDDEHPMGNGKSWGAIGMIWKADLMSVLARKQPFPIALMSRTASLIVAYLTVANSLGIPSLTETPSG